MGIDELKTHIHKNLKEIINLKKERFKPGKTLITTGLAVYDEREINAIIDSLIDGWFGLGKTGLKLEKNLAKYQDTSHAVLVNSGSSANFLALEGIKLNNNLKKGEIITPACTFPTTINPIIQQGFTPAILDVDKTLNIDPHLLSSAINKDTKGIMVPHTLGNPSNMKIISEMVNDNDLFLIEDCCDALGSRYQGKKCGSFGDASTLSFYPAHLITMGEGGAILTNDGQLKKTLVSLRDWGRECWCTTDEKNPLGACNRRFDYKINEIPYDHKYIYSNIGYNLKPLELQAAMGLVQLDKISSFIDARKKNYDALVKELQVYDKYINFPDVYDDADPVFFGLPITIKDKSIKRDEFLKFLNKNMIATRLVFAGNILMQPAYKNIRHKVYSRLDLTDDIMKNSFWIGVHPGISDEMISYMVSIFKKFFGGQKR